MQSPQLWRTAADKHPRCAKFDCGCLSSVHLALTRHCCLASFLIAWIRRMSADHCTGACLGELFCQLLQTVGAAPVSSSVSESLIRDFQFGRCSVFLDLQTSSYACGHRTGFCCRDICSRTRECQRRLLRVAGAKLDLHNGPSFRPLLSRVIVRRSTYFAAVNCLPPEATSGELFLHFWANTCGSFAVAQVQHAENLHHLK